LERSLRYLNAAKLVFTRPLTAARRARSLLQQAATVRRLRAASLGGDAPAWLEYDGTWFPYHNDGDEQEIFYHAKFREWRNYELEAIGPYVQPGSVVVDVGANMGFITLILAELAGKSGHVHAFEPSWKTFGKLSRVASRNHITNVTLHNYGLGATAEERPLAIFPSSGHASLSLAASTNGGKEMVKIERLDDKLGPQLSRLDFIKIDTEGFESEVLKGADATITRFRPVVLIELAADFLNSSQEAIAWLTAHGYRFPLRPDCASSRNGMNYFALPL
jgi:FkbM family methyltransferase